MSDIQRTIDGLIEEREVLRISLLAAEDAFRKKNEEIIAAKKEQAAASAPPVDRSARVVSGEALAPGVANTENRGDGQQKGYVMLSEEERRKGFARPVRKTYVHQKCGGSTTMSVGLAETYARDPKFYSGTFCCRCGAHFPVGSDGEFTWEGTEEKVGS